MARDITGTIATAAAAGVIRPVWFVAYQTSDLSYTRLWSGLGSKTWDGNVYTGAGNFLGVSAIKEEANMAASGAAISLSGAPSAAISQALDDFRHGLAVQIWLGFLNVTTKAILADPYQIFIGTVDAPEILEEGKTSTITLTAENRLIRIRKATNRRYTNEDQKELYNGDLGFIFVRALANSEITWV